MDDQQSSNPTIPAAPDGSAPLCINGIDTRIDRDPRTTLLDALRDRAGLMLGDNEIRERLSERQYLSLRCVRAHTRRHAEPCGRCGELASVAAVLEMEDGHREYRTRRAGRYCPQALASICGRAQNDRRTGHRGCARGSHGRRSRDRAAVVQQRVQDPDGEIAGDPDIGRAGRLSVPCHNPTRRLPDGTRRPNAVLGRDGSPVMWAARFALLFPGRRPTRLSGTERRILRGDSQCGLPCHGVRVRDLPVRADKLQALIDPALHA